MFAILIDTVREVVRFRKAVAFAKAVWWCPFCDHSNQLAQDVDGSLRPCAKCEARIQNEPPAEYAAAGARFPDTPASRPGTPPLGTMHQVMATVTLPDVGVRYDEQEPAPPSAPTRPARARRSGGKK